MALDDTTLQLVQLAIAEDVRDGDVTTQLTVAPDAGGSAVIRQKAPGVVFGHEVAYTAFTAVDGRISYEPRCDEGSWREGGAVAELHGPLGSLLSAERVAMNFLMHLSGVATAAALAVRAVAGTGATILDTRKTTPGMRTLEKAAVAAGGASNHRMGLFDAILIKENHIAAAGGLAEAVARCRAGSALPVEVECSTIDEVREALAAGADRLLLDNMPAVTLREVVTEVAGRVPLEASGGYTVDNVREAAETGVDFISLGSLTHSAKALDLSMLVMSGATT